MLEPLAPETARAIVAGEPDGLQHGAGWPQADTLDGVRMVAEHGAEAWLILEDGVVVGDAGTFGSSRRRRRRRDRVRPRGAVARPRLASEFVPALAQHVLAREGVRRVVARGVLADNVPSRRALERAGFEVEREEAGLVWYALE